MDEDQNAGSGVVYIEWLYSTMHAMPRGVAVNTYLVTAPLTPNNHLIVHEDNPIPKVTFWPLLIGTMVVITLLGP